MQALGRRDGEELPALVCMARAPSIVQDVRGALEVSRVRSQVHALLGGEALMFGMIDPTSSSSPELGQPIANAANAIIQTGVLGALLILAVTACFVAVWKLNKTNEARVKDQQEMTKALVDLTTNLRETLSELTGITGALKEAVQKSTEQGRSMERTLNETVRDAIRSLRRFSPPGGTPAGGRG